MRIAPSPAPQQPRIANAPAAAANTSKKSAARHVEPQRTPVSRGDLRAAIGRAYQKLNGHAPSAGFLDTLTAQASLETGSGSSMYNYNFGGIKGASPTGETAVCRTKEVFDGKEVEVRDGFRAYHSLDDGAEDYVRLMQNRFGEAVSQAEKGDLDGFAHALKKAHYYTADESKYASALHTLAGTPAIESAASKHIASGASLSHGIPALPTASLGGGFGSSSNPNGYADTMELGRVLNAIARHPTVVDDEDD